jgi:hypothetical protein
MINTDIYDALCINQDKPELECHGKCHLSEELDQSQSEDNDSPMLEINMRDFPIGFVHFFNLEDVYFDLFVAESSFNNIYHFTLEYDIFNPPKFLS